MEAYVPKFKDKVFEEFKDKFKNLKVMETSDRLVLVFDGRATAKTILPFSKKLMQLTKHTYNNILELSSGTLSTKCILKK